MKAEQTSRAAGTRDSPRGRVKHLLYVTRLHFRQGERGTLLELACRGDGLLAGVVKQLAADSQNRTIIDKQRPLNNILQFADVTRPRVASHGRQGGGAQPGRIAP